MNCANHPDRERTAFCQNCGKPLCAECIRNVGTSVFCEPCLAARVAGSAPAAGYGYTRPPGYSGVPPVYHQGPPRGPAEPNPGLAALLGFIPGVGAMYNEQYAKGIVHLIVFAVLVSLADASSVFWLFVWGWVFYMVIEAHHTARARRDGTPLPNPFGLNDLSERLGFGRAWPSGTAYPGAAPTPGPVPPNAPGSTFSQAADGSQTYSAPGAYFHQGPDGSQTYATPDAYFHQGPGGQVYSTPGSASQGAYPGVPPNPPVPPMPPYPDANLPYYRRFPSGAIWLILLGVFFMVGNTGVFHIFRDRLFGPFLLIGLGAWLFVHRMIATGHGLENDGTADYHWRLSSAVNSSIWVVLVGVVWLLNSLHILSWSRSWPIYMIAAGVLGLLRHSLNGGYGAYSAPAAQPYATPAAPPVTTTEIVPSPTSHGPSGDGQEGR
jgi:hypothetical protein